MKEILGEDGGREGWMRKVEKVREEKRQEGGGQGQGEGEGESECVG